MSSAGSDFLSGGGGMAGLIRSKDWAETPLGSIETWPQSLRTTVSLCLASNFPINIIWGPTNTQIYNDGYRIVCGEAHPRALGEGYDVTWASAWPAIGEPFARALAGETTFLENQRMFLTRNGYLEETFFTFSTSPIRDESGGIGGLFHPVTETTATMLAERRTRALRELTAALGTAEDIATLVSQAITALRVFDGDLPFLLFYARDDATGAYHLVGRHGLEERSPACPMQLDPAAIDPWPFAAAFESSRMVECEGMSRILGGHSCGPYLEPPDRAFILPLNVSGVLAPAAIMVAGASPRLPLSEPYRGFYELLGSALSAALTSVRAREDERRRTEALAAIDRAKTQFFSNVSHEFRTPLTLMLGPLEETLARSHLPSDDRERVALAHRNGRRLLKLVDSLLDFSRVEAGRAKVAYQPVDLAAFTSELTSNFRSACERAGLGLVVDAKPLPKPVLVDHDMWEKIVLNLLSNAFKFTLEGELRVTVRASADGMSAEVAISDTGLGIPATELPRLFERFHRVEGARGRSFEGSGIGLALVQELVGLHGGSIAVASELGRGSTFTVRIPFGLDHAATPAHPVDGPSANATRASTVVEEVMSWLPASNAEMAARTAGVERSAVPTRGRILLADDNADMRNYVGRLLSAEGLIVESTLDGEAALVAARRRPPDLILTDVMMPRLDGFGLLHAVRSDPGLRGVPVILLSARAGEEARVEGLDAGADDYLVKPFAGRELVSRVIATLNRSRDLRGTVLRESEARLRLAVEAGQIGEWELDVGADSSVRAFRHDQIFGHEEPVERWGFETFLGHVVPDDRPSMEAAFKAAAATRNGWNFQCRIRRSNDGAIRWINGRSTPQLDADGRAMKLFGMVQDVTEEKLNEEALRELNDTLEHRVAEAVEERSKAQEQLRHSQKLEAVGQLTGGVAHDFNNLLTVIRSSIDLLARPDLAEDRRKRYMLAISDTVTRATKLTSQLLTFARRQALHPEVFDVGKDVAALTDMFGTLTGSRIEVVMSASQEACTVEADPSHFDTALINMVANARDAMQGEGRLMVTVHPVAEVPKLRAHEAVPGDFVAICVEDTGVGIPDDLIEQIFEPFFTTKDIGQGTGLGLSQVFGFAKQSNGEVRVQSVVGEGTKFVLYLPRVAANDVAA